MCNSGVKNSYRVAKVYGASESIHYECVTERDSLS
jgi:hypothetical protein